MLTFLAGAALGAVVVALATRKSGPELRGDLKSLARRAKRRADGLVEDAGSAWDEMKSRTAQAATLLKRGVADAMDDLRGSPSGPPPVPSQPNHSQASR
jgi:gas vesicle protein